MMRRATRLQGHLGRRKLGKECFEPGPSQIAAKHRSLRKIDPVQGEHGLGRIHGNSFKFHPGGSFV